MTKKSFLAGWAVALIVGIPLATVNEIAGLIIGITIGSLLAASKKGGGAIGFLTAPWIYLSPYIVPLMINYLRGNVPLLNLLLLIGYGLLDIVVIIFTIVAIILGVIFGYIGLRIAKKS
ncbi:MAG: hypothetical protein ACTSVA_01400 [Candidatus Njordarchaeales archaeon]